jgi:hypothetical protein
VADYFQSFSVQVAIPKEKWDAVDAALKELDDKWNAEEPDWSLPTSVMEPEEGGIWIYSEDYYDHYGLVMLVQTILKAMDEDKPVLVPVGYTCSKPRLDGFGGGCHIIWRDREDYIDAEMEALRRIGEGGE